MSLLRLKLAVLVCTVGVLASNSATAAILYGTTLDTHHLVKIDTIAQTVTILETTPGTPDSLILRGTTLIYDLNDVSTIRIFDTVALTDVLIADGTNHIVGPQDMTTEPGGNSILVSNFAGGGANGNITRVLLNGTQNGTVLTNMVAPQGLAYDSAGRLFVVAGDNNGNCPATGTAQVFQLNPVTGAVINTSAAFDPSNSLDGLIFDPFTGHLFVTSKCSGTLYEVDPATLNVVSAFCTATGTVGACAAGPNTYPDGLATDGHGTLYLVLRNDFAPGTNAKVAAFSITGKTIAPALTVPGLDDLSQVVAASQTITKSFSAPTCPPVTNSCITVGNTTTLTFVISNPNGIPLTGLSFTDTFPSQIQVAGTPNATNTCGGTFTTTGGAGSVILAAGSIPGATGTPPVPATCTLTVQVTGVATGTGTNTVMVSSNEGGTSPSSMAPITVTPPPMLPVVPGKSFSPKTISVTQTSTLTVTFVNPLATPGTAAFTDTFPAGLVVAATPSVANNCGGTVTALAGAPSATLVGGTVPATGSCAVSFNVSGPIGVFVNTLPAPSNSSDTVTIVGPPVLTKAFNPPSIGPNGTTTLTFTVVNPNTTTALTNVTFTDTLPTPPAGLMFAGGLTGTCNGTAPVITPPNTISLTGATLPAGGTCTFSAMVTGPNAGLYNNITSNITALIPNGTLTGPPGTAPLGIQGPPTDPFQIRYASNLNVGDSFVNITNTGASTTGTAAGNLCVIVYTFDQSEELLSCCSCFVTPNGLASMSVKQSLVSNDLTPEIPNSVVIKLLATAGGASAASCNAALPGGPILAGGMRAWGTTLHAAPTSPTSYAITETPFLISDLSAAELNHLTTFCAFIQSNASGFGICKGCSPLSLGATTAR